MLQCNLGMVFLRYHNLGSMIKINRMITVTNAPHDWILGRIGQYNHATDFNWESYSGIGHLRNCTEVLLEIKYTCTIHNLKWEMGADLQSYCNDKLGTIPTLEEIPERVLDCFSHTACLNKLQVFRFDVVSASDSFKHSSSFIQVTTFYETVRSIYHEESPQG